VRLQAWGVTDLTEFGLGHAGLLSWGVAKPRVPGHAPDQAQDTGEPVWRRRDAARFMEFPGGPGPRNANGEEMAAFGSPRAGR
jgi:hypothetical protein